MGDRARGLQPRRRGLDLVLARPGPLAGVPLERGRARWDLRHRSAPVPGVRVLERAGPDPQGADLRPHEQRGQPRRGRQGALVVRRLHADALLDALALRLSPARLPLRGPRRGERPPRVRRPRVRAARHRRAGRRPLLGHRGRLREVRAGGPVPARAHPQRRARRRRAAPAPHAVVPQPVVVGRRPRSAGHPRGRRRRSWRTTTTRR